MEDKKLMVPGKWCTTFDENGNVITTVYEESFRILMGFGPENDDGNESWADRIHPDDAERVANYFADCCLKHPEGMDYDIEYRMMTTQGYHWFHDFAHCERSEDGSIIRMDGAVFDIQEGFDKVDIIKHEKLKTDAFSYLVDHEDEDPVELLKEFAPRIREILGCDQIIYRDLEETRIMVNSPEIEKTWAVPIEYCQQCQHFDAHHPMYKDGYTEMSNCQEGWQGIPVYKDCPIKSSLTRIVYCDGNVNGYLAIHYVQKYHLFTDVEHSSIEEFSNILSLALSRYEAKKRSSEALADNATRFFALEDDFMSLYDVELESGFYTSFDRDDFYKRNISDLVVSSTEFFKDLRTNVERVVYEEDREDVYNVQTREAIIEGLSEKDHIDHYYRVITENGPMWLKMRIVYKDTSKKNVIVGIFNAEEEMAVRQKEEQFKEELIQNNARLFALEDDFESLYDVELESGHYEVYVKGDFFRESVIDKLTVPKDYFAELRENIDAVIYLEDRNDLYNKLTRESIVSELADNEHFDYYYRINTDNGPRWLKIRIVYKDAEKKNVIIGVFNAEKDVEAKQISEHQERLEEEQRRNDIIHDIIHSGKWSFFVNANDEIVESYYSEEVMNVINNDLSTGAQEWTDILHPDDKEEALKAFMATVTDHSCQTPYDVTYRMLDRNGLYHWFHSAGRIIRDEEGNGELFGVHMNIDDQIEDQLDQQRKLEEQNAQLEKDMQMISGLASGYNALYYINIDENELHIYALDEAKYPGSRAIFEGEEKDFYKIIGGYGLSDQVHPDDRHLFQQFGPEWIREKLKDRKKYSMRFRAATENGYRWDEMELTKYEDLKEQANAVAVGFTDRDADIRREQEYQTQLEEAREAADAANKSKSNFLFNMSHDIRTPMNAIRGFTTMAKKNADDKEKVIGYLDKIDISGQQLLTLINQVLEMARIESGKIEFEEKPINVIKEFNSMITVLSEQAKANGLKFIHTLGNIEHDNIFADEARMSSITLNIVGNAMKYTPEGGTVEYDLREIEGRKPGYATFVFTVSDTGIGMSKEYLEELYEPFSREKSSTVSKIQGTGLGLPIVKNIIDLIGGNIEVQSELGKGTRFDITVDLRIEENVEVGTEKTEEVGMISFKGRRVLLVEDNEMNREIARDILEEQGIIVEDADDGDVAVAMVKEVINRGEFHYYDFILMDVQMPRMNGYDATKAIREIPGPDGVHIPIIAMTANAFEEDRQNALASGMDEHLAKPIDVQKAFRTIARFLK